MTDKKPLHQTRARWLFISDVDDTLLGSDTDLQELNRAMALSTDSIVVAYNSSRPCQSLRRSIKNNPYLTVPDYLIGALGTEIQDSQTDRLLVEYSLFVDQHWNRERVFDLAVELGFIPHGAEFQTPLKASFDVKGIQARVEIVRRLEEEELEAKVIFSGSKNLDLIPEGAGKGNAIHFLSKLLAIDPSFVVVAGDSGNDLEMFEHPRRGIVVANADEELIRLRADHIYHASADYAGGVLEGLRYWGVVD